MHTLIGIAYYVMKTGSLENVFSDTAQVPSSGYRTISYGKLADLYNFTLASST